MTMNDPMVTIEESTHPKLLWITYLGLSTVVLLLALFMPFFRSIFIFGTLIITAISILSVSAAYKDRKAGVKRIGPRRSFTTSKWKWAKNAFFLTMICLSAGMQMGWYIIPLCWILNWICLESFIIHMRATYKEEKGEEIKA